MSAQTESSQQSDARPRGIVARVARWATQHRRTVVIGWIALLVVTLAISGAVGTRYSNNFSLGGTDSQRATDLLKRDFPAQAGDEDTIVLHARQGSVTDPAIRARVEPVLARVARLPHVIGVGVGIDYALFIVTRFREEHRAGATADDAAVAAMDTAGRAVLFAGTTVIIALLGMFALGVSFLYGVAIGSAIAVLLTMLASLTVLPALLSRFGERLARPGRRARAGGGSFWRRWSAGVQRRPWPAAIAGVAIMLVLTAPVLSMHLGTGDQGNDPTSRTTRRAYDLLATGFGKGFNGPLLVVAQLPQKGDTGA